MNDLEERVRKLESRAAMVDGAWGAAWGIIQSIFYGMLLAIFGLLVMRWITGR